MSIAQVVRELSARASLAFVDFFPKRQRSVIGAPGVGEFARERFTRTIGKLLRFIKAVLDALGLVVFRAVLSDHFMSPLCCE